MIMEIFEQYSAEDDFKRFREIEVECFATAEYNIPEK